MESRNPFRHILAVVVAMVPLIYIGMKWSTIPGTVATHFDIHGQPDAFGDKMDIVWLSLFMVFTSLITYVMVVNAHKLDKKRTKGIHSPLLDNIALGTVFFICIVNLAAIINSIYPGAQLLDKMIIPAIGVFFVFIGNVMYNIKPNRFVGIRIPWTLNNDDNWKVTHRLGSKLFFVGGVFITLVALGYQAEIATMFLLGVVFIISVTTVLYSYLYHRKSQNEHV